MDVIISTLEDIIHEQNKETIRKKQRYKINPPNSNSLNG